MDHRENRRLGMHPCAQGNRLRHPHLYLRQVRVQRTQGVRFSFSWSVYSPDCELKFYPHTKTSISRRNLLRQHVFSFPAEVFCRGRQRDGSRAVVDIGFNRWRRFEDLSFQRPAPIALPDSGEDCFLCFCFNLITHGYVGDRNCRDDATCNLPSGHSPRVADAGGS